VPLVFVKKLIFLFMLAGLLVVLQGCANLASSKRPPVSTEQISVDGFNPAGLWIYEDNIVFGEAEFDENGNGSYPWKKGYFVTESWQGGVWTGTWVQPGNDREGRFELKLSEDLNSATGRWWYTRIGDDTSPDKPGGRFSLTRL